MGEIYGGSSSIVLLLFKILFGISYRGHLANFINDRNNSIIQEARRSVGIYGDSCRYLIVNSSNLNVRVINRGMVNTARDFEIIGAGEDYTHDVFDIFTRFSAQGTQIRSLIWNNLLQQKIMSHKQLILRRIFI